MKPRGRTMFCPHCAFAGHRDLAAAFTIATRTPGSAFTISPDAIAGMVTHRRAGRHLPGVRLARRDPRRRLTAAAGGSVGRRRPARSMSMGSRSLTGVGEDSQSSLAHSSRGL
ncbi:hypothetical protein [Paractinoplanes atraurantiacus]|uniref:hypothetical protein n=1 Tax=Paractinoplanes atraurantiacus TaxID=1036182 RepID=UPI0034DB7200